jgi:hypothetical protein
MLTRRRRQRTQGGQVLILALAFVAFFGLVTTAVLQFADAVQLQQSHEQSAAIQHADAEGGMLFATEADLQLGACPSGPTSITMGATGDVATITSCTDQSTVYPGDCALGPYLNAVTVTNGSQRLGEGEVLVGRDCTDGQGGMITGIISISYGS